MTSYADWLEAQFWDADDPARDGALVHILTSNADGATVAGYDGDIWWAQWDELERRA